MLEKIEQDLSKINRLLDRPILIYGAGNFGGDVCEALIKQDRRVIGFLDAHAEQKKKWHGLPVYLPSERTDLIASPEEVVVLVAIHNYLTDIAEIDRILRQNAYKNILIPVEYMDILVDLLGDRYWLTDRTNYAGWKNKIDFARGLWAEEESKHLYNTLIEYRIKGDPHILPQPDFAGRYYAPRIRQWPIDSIRLIECGSFDGDSLLAARSSNIDIESMVLFEPDPINFKKLSTYVKSNWEQTAICVPSAVSSCTKQMRFSAEGTAGSSFSQQGELLVQAIALDDVLSNYRPTMIQMDIEGAELDALCGAVDIIHADKPALAISVYHRPEHLWQIPTLIDEWGLRYRFYLRSHGYNDFDVVMYAISEG